MHLRYASGAAAIEAALTAVTMIVGMALTSAWRPSQHIQPQTPLWEDIQRYRKPRDEDGDTHVEGAA